MTRGCGMRDHAIVPGLYIVLSAKLLGRSTASGNRERDAAVAQNRRRVTSSRASREACICSMLCLVTRLLLFA
jgi:hypothetical protein